jgi:hypothetical protein
MRSRFYSLIAIMGLASGSASAAMVAADNAGNYNGGNWSLSAPNNGSGFGGWLSFATNNNGPPYAGTYYDNSGKTIGTGGNSWGAYANTAQGNTIPRVDLVRPFLPAGGGYSDPSSLGTLFNQTFSVAYQSDGIGNAGQGGGISLDTGQGAGAVANPVLTIGYLGGGTNNMTLIDNNGTDNTTVPINFNNLTNGIIISVTVGANPDGLNPYTVTISPAPGNATFTTPVVLTGSENGPIQQVDMFNNNATNNQYFNSLAISAELPVPEPATIGMLGASALLLMVRRRRRAE